ncbi:MAG: hypothetical protein GY839_01395, partial [candidate division Zixibacteria bacterium]|nr:hypothetical protein [candidate division Zixibacteria bacterium]
MKKPVVWIIVAIVIILLAVLYFDIFNLTFSKEKAYASIIHYEDARWLSDKLTNYLSDYDPEIRTRAALAVGRIGESEGAALLFEMLGDSVETVAETAAFGIGLCGDKDYADKLLGACESFPPPLQAMVIQAVGRLADSTMPFISDEIARYLDHIDHRVREQTAYALWRSGGKMYAEQLERMCLEDPVRPVQIAALYALCRMGIAETIYAYEEWLPDSDPFVRSLSIRGLALGKDDTQTRLIASGLNDRNNNVVSQTVASLGSIGSYRALNYIMGCYDNLEDEKIKTQILTIMGRLNNSSATDYALADIHDSANANIVGEAIVYLAKVGYHEIIPLLDSIAVTSDPRLNVKIAEALVEIGGEMVKPRLITLFSDSSAMVRAAAFDALTVFDTINIDYYIRKAFNDSDYVVCAKAVDKIGELKKIRMLPQLMTIIMMHDLAETDLKRSVIDAAGQFIPGSSDSLAEEILNQGLMDYDYLVSKDAAKIYKDKLGIDKDSYSSKPFTQIGERKIKSLIKQYKNNPHAIISTKYGDIEIELFFDIAPLTVFNFITLTNRGFYDNLLFHRVIPNFVVQGGDPRGDGWGGPGHSIRCEYSNLSYNRGTVGIAHSGKDSGGSQFFITHTAVPHLDARYTIFGTVLTGM